jgi:hypothetical protein
MGKKIQFMMKTKNELIREGVSRVKNLGFEMVNDENIYFDEVYSAYFQNMLQNKRGISKYLDDVIEEIIKEIENRSKI